MNFLRNFVMIILFLNPLCCIGSESENGIAEVQETIKNLSEEIQTFKKKFDELSSDYKNLNAKYDLQEVFMKKMHELITSDNQVIQLLLARGKEQERFNSQNQDSKEEKRPRTRSKEEKEKKKSNGNGSSKEKES